MAAQVAPGQVLLPGAASLAAQTPELRLPEQTGRLFLITSQALGLFDPEARCPAPTPAQMRDRKAALILE